MEQKSEIIALLRYEEGVKYQPYIDTLGYPTIGVGFKLGPQGAALSNFTLALTDNVINIWLMENINSVYISMGMNDEIKRAMSFCNQPRKDILASMAYQMGVGGLAKFHKTLSAIAHKDWDKAAEEMKGSVWEKQTPHRVARHISVILSGQWAPVYNFKL